MSGPRMVFLWTLLAALACGRESGAGDSTEGTEPGEWQLSAAPLVEIGVVAGNPNYELHAATSSVRLEDARILVANTGTQELRMFDSEGRYLWKAGGRGAGPGEFRWLSRVYLLAADSIMAYDQAGDRLSIFNSGGEFVRTALVDRSDDPDFPLDVWLYQQYWVDGARESNQRELIKSALRRMPVPPHPPAYRFARVGYESNIWVREPRQSDRQSQPWTVFDSDGQRIATVETPPRFDLHHIGSDFVLGRWQDDQDVNYIRLYGLRRPRATDRAGELVPTDLTEPSRAEPPSQEEEEAYIAAMVSSLRNLVMAQESYFVGHMSYSADRSALEWTGAEGVSVDIITADSRGWAAVFTHVGTRTICGVFVGSGRPPGWTGEAIPKCR